MPPVESHMTELDLDALPDPEDKGKVTGFEIEGDEPKQESEPEVEIVDDTPVADRNRKPLNENPDDIPEDELAEYSAKVKERIGKLRHGYHDERRAREQAAREREEALRYAQGVLEENKRLQTMYATGERVFGQTLETAAKAQLDMAKKKVKDAYEAGDADALVEAQEELAAAKYRLEQSSAFAARQQQQTPLQDENFQQQSVQRVPQPAPRHQPDERALQWQKENPWFGSDDEMTSFALGAHKKLVESGVDPRTSEYYERLNARIRQVFPEYFRLEDPTTGTPAKRPATVVAPQTRQSAPKKLVLTKSQVAIAKRLGVPVEEYARQVALLENRNG